MEKSSFFINLSVVHPKRKVQQITDSSVYLINFNMKGLPGTVFVSSDNLVRSNGCYLKALCLVAKAHFLSIDDTIAFSACLNNHTYPDWFGFGLNRGGSI